MAGSFSAYSEAKLLRHSVGAEAWAMPAGIWLGLLCEDATATDVPIIDDDDLVNRLQELSGNNYHRVKVSQTVSGTTSTVFGSVTGGQMTNNGASNVTGQNDGSTVFTGGNGTILFAAADDGDWPPVVAVGLFDTSASSNEDDHLLWYGFLTTPRVVRDGDILEFPQNSLQFFLT